MFSDLFYFDKDHYFFNRYTKDMSPTRIYEKDGKVQITINALGVSKDDVTIDVTPAKRQGYFVLRVKGETVYGDENENKYSINIPFQVYEEPKDIVWEMKNGLLFMTVEFKEPVFPAVNIKYKE